jgi:cation transport ATPase
VGIAMGSGTDVAIDSADVVLVSEDIRTLDTVFDLSRATMRNIKENLFWAFFYNVVMIPLAAGVFYSLGLTFNPTYAAAAMSLSSLFVCGNALRLLRYKNKKWSVKTSGKGGEKVQSEVVSEQNSHVSDGETAENNSVFASENEAENEEVFMKKIVSIEGMCCEHCAKRVEGALSAVPNVVSADVKLKKNLAIIRSREEVSDEAIKQAVEDIGYHVAGIEVK